MTDRERIINTVLCKQVDRLPFTFYFGTWRETEDRWHSEGLLQNQRYDYNLHMDKGFKTVPINYGYSPCFEHVLIENKGDTSIVIDTFGITMEVSNIASCIPKYIDHPVKDLDSWLQLKTRLDVSSKERFPENWKDVAKELNNSGNVIQLGEYPYGLFGTLRDMMGVEELLVSFYTQPELIHDMMDYMTDFWISIYEKAVQDVRVDAVHMWEDMSGTTGSLISPQMVREFMMPNYKKIKEFTAKNNIPIFSLDTDGDVAQLVPLFVECGINLIFPFEVAAGCDVNEYREKYPNLCLMGGIDKRELTKTTVEIDAELKRLEKMFKGSGYIPSVDHLLHPQISYENFLYFIKRLKECLGIKV